ncbi:MAG: LysR family transcriptional regulator [Bdellovibrionales bacterium]|nr:LysR family transcriptional regulator [Bdellovibrionales bacterium]
MPLKDHLGKLLAFEAVCRLKSFSQAALELHVSQPAVSKAISVLETALGVELINRTRKGVFPTVQGSKLLRSSNDILAIAKAFDDQSEDSKRLLRIGTKEPIAAHLLSEFIGIESDRTIELIVERSNAHLLRLLLRGELHLLVIPESKFPQNVRRSTLFSSRWGAYASPTATSRRLIVFPETLAGKGKLQDYLAIEKEAFKVQSFETALVMAAKGMGMAVLPAWVARDHLRAGTLIESKSKEVSQVPQTRVCAVTSVHRENSISATVRKLRQHCSNLGLHP